MNKILLAVNAILVIAVGFLFYKVSCSDCCSNGGSSSEAPLIKTDAKLMPVTNKIAFYRADSVSENFVFLKEKAKALEAEQKRLEGTLEGKMQAMQARYGELQQKAATMTQQEMEAAQMEMQQTNQQIEELRYKMAGDLDKKRMDMQKDVFDKLNTFLKKYNQKQNFDYILSYVDGGQVMLTKDTLDITIDVINGLNKEYPVTKKAK